MAIDIPESVRQKATRCTHDLGCLSSGRCGDRDMCNVAHSYGENLLRLVTDRQAVCPYRLTFGNSQICTCPVREYLFMMKILPSSPAKSMPRPG